jgi:hypothetical protein
LHYPETGRHRDEALRLLASMYDQAIVKLRQQAQDPELGAAFIALTSSLKKAVEPVVSLRVKEDLKGRAADPNDPGPFGTAQKKNREKHIREKLVERITGAVTSPARDPITKGRDELMRFVQVEETVPSLIEVAYAFVPEPKAAGSYRVEWTVQIRTTPEGKAVSKTWTSPGLWNEGNLTGAVEEEIRRTESALGVQEGAPGFNPPIKF